MSSLGKLIALASWVAVKRGKRKRAVDVENETDKDFVVNSGFCESLGRLNCLGTDDDDDDDEEGGGGSGDLVVAEALSAITYSVSLFATAFLVCRH